jgi:hypothetical protein
MSEKDNNLPPPNTNTDDERIHSFYRQMVSVTLQRVQVAIILSQAVVTAGEASYRLGVLPALFLIISLLYLLRATGDGFRS